MTSVDREQALFEALNAKKLTPPEIAAGFVISSQYEQLVGPDHTYLVGPRGSGKTTLLRMLEGPALMRWDHRSAAMFRRRVSYSTVFLPADRLWAAQIQSGSPSGDLSTRVGVAAFGTQMLYALVEALKYRLGYDEGEPNIHLPAELRHRSEVELVYECAEAWGLQLSASSLVALQHALELRILDISNIIEDWDVDIDSVKQLPWLRYSPLAMFRFGIRAINRHTNQPNHRWGLLLDEMELAPRPVHQALLSSLRGSERSLVVKLSFSPFDRYIGSQQSTGDAYADHDFKAIYLWYGTRLGGRRFTGGLWRRMFTDRHKYRPASDVLGPSKIEISGGVGVRRNSYAKDGPELQLLKDTAGEDAGFAQYVEDHGIDLARTEDLSYDKRSATLRKIYPLIVFRNALLEFDNGIPKRRQRRKVTDCFTGVDAVFAALEGNPRWIKAVFSQLLSVYEGSGRIDQGLQYDVLVDAAERFESLLRILAPNQRGTSRSLPLNFSILDLLDTIATYFSERNLNAFQPDPPSVFRVDDKVSDDVLGALETALSAGAVIHLRSKQSPTVLPTLVGERFRLAYLLTIRKGKEIPFRIGKEVALTRIIESTPEAYTLPMWEN
jgi:hypothetical protein